MKSRSSPVDEDDFDKECGVGESVGLPGLITLVYACTGFLITPEQLTERVSTFITSSAVAGWANFGAVISDLKVIPELRWANPLDIKNAVESTFTKSFGPKESAKPKAKVRIQHIVLSILNG